MQPIVAISCALVLALAGNFHPANAQGMGDVSAMEDSFEAGAPSMEMGGGDFFSQELGTLLRLRYNTESYGQDRRGNFDIGTMQVQSFEDAIAFFDGQVTLNDVNGVGYNLGIGFRWLHWSPFPIEPERISGFSFWTDGTSTESGNFFPQIGLSFESLGDRFDLRVNGYIPVGEKSQIGEFTPTGDITFNENFLVMEATADRNTSFYVAEAELAARLLSDRDAWAFAGPYTLVNDEQDAAGYRAGFRGYAYPDLMVQIAVTDDDIFKTRAAFQVTWFVGRTRTNFQPACGLADRMREPVMRNDYVALQRTTVVGGEELLDSDGDPIRFVHVDSAAADGGDGTFENPLNNVGNVQANSLDGDIVLMWAQSVFQSQNTLVLQDNQRLLGEGDGAFFTVATQQQGVVVIPETSPGARDEARPIIMDALGMGAVRLADANEVANFEIDGSAGAGIFSQTAGAGNPNIHDLEISNTTGNGIDTTPFSRVDGSLTTVAGNVTIDNVVFDNIGGDDIHIDSETSADVDDPNVTLQEVIAISNIESTGVTGTSLFIENTHSGTGRTTTITNYDYDGGTGTGGGMRFENFGGTLTASSSTIVGGTDSGVFVGSNANGDSTGTFTFANTFTIDNVDTDVPASEAAFVIDGFTGILSMAGTIDNDTGRSLLVQNVSDNTASTTAITFSGDITDNTAASSRGILIQDNTGGTILLSGDIDVSTTNDAAITLLNNASGTDQTDINFTGALTIASDGGNGFDATGGGILTVAGNTNTIDTTGGTGLRITDMEISTAGANFATVNSSGGFNGIFLEDNTDGPITVGVVGDTPPDGGLISGTTMDAIVINNSANVSISGVEINNSMNAVAGVHVEHTTNEAMTLNLNDLRIINDMAGTGDVGIEVMGGSTEDLTMTVNDTDILNQTAVGMDFDNVDNGTVSVNNVTIDGQTAGTVTGVDIINSDATFTFDADTTISGTTGTAFNVSGGEGTISMAGDITNSAGRSIAVQNITDGSVTLTGTVTDTGAGILVNSNTGGDVNLNGDYTLTTMTNDAVTITNNIGADVSIGDFEITTTTGQGFVATGGGDLTVNGADNTITTGASAGAGLRINGMNIVTQATFESVSVDGAANGIVLNNVTGSTITIGDTGNAAGEGGTIQNTTDDGIRITNTASTVLNGVTVNDAGSVAGENAVLLQHSNSANMSVTMNDVTIDTNFDGLDINGTGGTNTFNVTTTGGTITAAETALEVQGRVSTVNLADDITNTAGRSISIHDVTAGTITHTGTVDDTGGTGISIANNTGGTMSLLGDYNLNTVGNDAVTITNNTGATIELTNLDIDTTSGDGFVATGGGTLTVSGTTNTINTGTGVGLQIEDMTIGAGGANFQRVTVTNGATSGILLSNLTGGQVLIGNTSGASNSSQLTTTGDAIVITNVENVDLNHVQIINSSGGDGIVITHNNSATTGMDVTIDDLNLDAASGSGINLTADNDSDDFALRLTDSDVDNANVVMDVTGGGHFGLLVDNTDINTDLGSTDDAFSLVFHDGATSADVTIRNNSNFTADDGSGLFVDSFDATAKSIRLLVQDSTFTNTTGSDFAANIVSRGTTILQTTVQGNTFTAVGATHDMAVQSSGTATSQMRLNLGGEPSDPEDFNTAAGQGTLFVSQAGTSVFSIFELTDTLGGLRNNDPVNDNGGTFQNLATPPTLPTVP